MSDFLRFRRRTLQTPVHHFVHPDTGRRIAVIGTMHMGEPGYFAGLRTVIDELEADGAVVQCEASSLLLPDEQTEQTLTDDERTVLAMRERKVELELRRVTELGWVRQLDAFGYPDRWQKVDLSALEIMRRIGTEVMLRGEVRGIKMFDRPDNDPRSIEQFRLLLHLMFTGLRFTVWSSARRAARSGTPASGVDAVLIDQRDALALEALWGTEQDTVLIWGCAHLPGIEAGITSAGFVRDGATQWHTAAVLPTVRSIMSRLRALPRTAGTAGAVDATVPDTAAVEHDVTPAETSPRP
ncbi:hypothetical protein GCM10009827_101460 [Dactylosporangium maewongense]|uniref:Uncharacterized protein n=1 Tax=Dactylosporangium maewongense TaxID=634393 RepID=A0ABP4NP76_9ACTN